MTTYTRRENARRAGIASGIPSERVVITVHKSPEGLRFGWKESPRSSKKAEAALPAPKIQPVDRNGVKRPKKGGVCAAVWGWLDKNPGATVKEAKAVAPAQGWNPNNVACEFYRWRKFNCMTGHAKAA